MSGPAQKIVHVSAAALVDGQGRVLLARRPEGRAMAGLWEFPGGKIEPGETPEAALIRELKEELDIDILPSDLTPLTFASHDYSAFRLFMPVFLCRRWKGEARAKENQELAWAYPRDFNQYTMPPADIPLVPIIQKLI